jgi:RNA polymerase sigma factor (sigma-70 family)
MRGESLPSEELLAVRLASWQATGCEIDLDAIWREAEPFVSQVARRTLLRMGVRDPAASDDARSLVLNHLRRLPLGEVTRFDPTRGSIAYLRWLSKRRAVDTARQIRRRQETPISTLSEKDKHLHCLHAVKEENLAAETACLLREACATLERRSRLVIEHYLDARPQAETVRVLGVCEGTVTRLRQRAIDRLRLLLSHTSSRSSMRMPR